MLAGDAFRLDGEPLKLTGKVVWTTSEDEASPANPAGMGIEFLNLDEASLAVVSSFVGRREPLFYAD